MTPIKQNITAMTVTLLNAQILNALGPRQVRIPVKQVNGNKQDGEDYPGCAINFRDGVKPGRSFLLLFPVALVLTRRLLASGGLGRTRHEVLFFLGSADAGEIAPRLRRPPHRSHRNGTRRQRNYFDEMRIAAVRAVEIRALANRGTGHLRAELKG